MEKYDRQIRLFGIETQKKLKNLKIKIKSKKSFIAAEILKNFALLGVEYFILNTNVTEIYKKLVPTDVHEINKDIKIIFQYDIDNNKKLINENKDVTSIKKEEYKIDQCDISIHVDMDGDGIFVCSNCFLYDFDDKCKCIANDYTNNRSKENDLVRECLLGSILVQEILKKINGEKFFRKYKLEV
ncbi:SUMO-activating enzyme subunit 1 [Dictyocoela muelleri]|nr:SUMO-activating enzyme subunit 1 [Dictyocoela muelleri]